MLRNPVRTLAMVGIALLVMGFAPGAAQGAVSEEWVELGQGESDLYKFHYGVSFDEDGANTSAPMEIKFYAAPAGSARLTLRNAEQMRKWAREGKNEWFGLAQPQVLAFQHNCNNKNKPGAGTGYDKTCHDSSGNRIELSSEYAVWQAVMGASGDYWVVVQQTPGQTGPTVYRIVVSGPELTQVESAP